MEQVRHLGNGMHGNGIPWPALGTINVILARPKGDVKESSGVMFVVGGSRPKIRLPKEQG